MFVLSAIRTMKRAGRGPKGGSVGKSNRDPCQDQHSRGDRCAPAAPSLLKSRLGWPRCLTCVCASASCIARAHAHKVQRKRLRRAGQRRQMLTCCCRVARARWLQMRHSSRLYALLPGSTPSLRPCHAPPKLRGVRGLGGCGRAGSPQLLREGRGRLQARLTDREALVDRHARSFRQVRWRCSCSWWSASGGGEGLEAATSAELRNTSAVTAIAWLM